MNRDDLSWALKATLPHAGSSPQYAAVALENVAGALYCCATDGYSIGVSRVTEFAPNWRLCITPSEATDLMRFVRPAKVAEKDEHVEEIWAAEKHELHIGVGEETQVFDTIDHPLNVEDMLSFIGRAWRLKRTDKGIYDASIMARFAKAQRSETDRLQVFQVQGIPRNGISVVSVGEHFIGAVAGIENARIDTGIVESFVGSSAGMQFGPQRECGGNAA